MKTQTLILKLSLLIISTTGFSSCGLFYNYTLKNPSKVVQQIGYPSGKLPFSMVTSDLMAPSFSKKGQVYADGSIGNGLGAGLAVAVTNRSFFTFHWNDHFKENRLPSGSSYMEGTYDETYYDLFGVTQTITHDTAGMFSYSKFHELETNYLEVGYGQYKSLKKQFRNEWIAGTGTGKTINSYTYQYTTIPQTFNFTEKRKFINFYFQDDFAWVHKHFEATVIGRFNSYFFTNRSFEMTYWHEAPDYQKTAFSLESSFRVSYGFKSVKAYLQVTGTAPIASPEIEWTPVQLKGGVMMRFGKAN